MKQLFLDIETKIKAVCPEITFVNPYNSQFDQLEDQGAAIYSFPSPFALIEFLDDDGIWKQLGDGIQIADPLDVRIHLGSVKYNDENGNQERNLDIYALATKLFLGLNKFEPNLAVAFIRRGHAHDIQHTNLYHFAQLYRTSYVDLAAQESTQGITKDPPTDLEINASYEEPPYTKPL